MHISIKCFFCVCLIFSSFSYCHTQRQTQMLLLPNVICVSKDLLIYDTRERSMTGRLSSLDGLNQISKWPFYKHQAHALIARCRVGLCCYGNRCRLRIRAERWPSCSCCDDAVLSVHSMSPCHAIHVCVSLITQEL